MSVVVSDGPVDRFRTAAGSGHELIRGGRGQGTPIRCGWGMCVVIQGPVEAVVWESEKLVSDSADEGTEAHREEEWPFHVHTPQTGKGVKTNIWK